MAVSGVRARTSDAAARDASSASRGALDAAPRGNAASAAAANRASFDAFDGTGTSWRRRSSPSSPSSERDPNGRASEERASRRGNGVTRVAADASRRAATRSASRANVAPASGGGASRPLFDKRSADRSRTVSRAMRSSARRTNPRAPRNRAATGSMSSVSRYRSALGASAPNAESAEVSSRGGRSRESSSPKTPEEKARSPSSSRLVASRLSRRSKKAREELCPPCSPRASSVSNARTSAPSAAKRARRVRGQPAEQVRGFRAKTRGPARERQPRGPRAGAAHRRQVVVPFRSAVFFFFASFSSRLGALTPEAREAERRSVFVRARGGHARRVVGGRFRKRRVVADEKRKGRAHRRARRERRARERVSALGRRERRLAELAHRGEKQGLAQRDVLLAAGVHREPRQLEHARAERTRCAPSERFRNVFRNARCAGSGARGIRRRRRRREARRRATRLAERGARLGTKLFVRDCRL